jgi:hypothetical protein
LSNEVQIPNDIKDLRKTWKRWTRHCRTGFAGALGTAQTDFLVASGMQVAFGWHALHPDVFPEEMRAELGQLLTPMYIESAPDPEDDSLTRTPEEVARKFAAEFGERSGETGSRREEIETAYVAVLLDLFDVFLEVDAELGALPEQLTLTAAPLTRSGKRTRDLLPVWNELTTPRERRAAKTLREPEFVCGTVTERNNDGVITFTAFPSGHVLKAHIAVDNPELDVNSAIGGIASFGADGWVEFHAVFADLATPIDALVSGSVPLWHWVELFIEDIKPAGPQWMRASPALHALAFAVQGLLLRVSEAATLFASTEGSNVSSEVTDDVADTDDDVIEGEADETDKDERH